MLFSPNYSFCFVLTFQTNTIVYFVTSNVLYNMQVLFIHMQILNAVAKQAFCTFLWYLRVYDVCKFQYYIVYSIQQ